MRAASLLLLVAWCSLIQSFGAQYYVRTDGNNSNTGLTDSAGGAFLTIQFAANTAVAGDTVTVKAGTYSENVDITTADGSSGSPITFQASGVVNVQAFYTSRPWIVFDGFTMNGSAPTRGALIQSSGSLGVLGNAHNVVVKNCTFICDTVGQYHLISYGTNWIVNSNRFLQTWRAGVSLAGHSHIVTNCFFSATNGADCMLIVGHNMRITGNLITNWSGRTVANESLKVGMTYWFVSTNGTPSDFSNVGAGTWPYILGESYFGGHDGFTATGTTPTAWGGTVLDTSNHPDLIQASESFGYPPATNNLFESNKIFDLHAAQLGNISDDGSTGNVQDWIFRNNLFVRVDRTMNLFAPGFRFYHNTFYRSPTNQSQFVIYGASAAGTASNLWIANNIFFECSEDPASTTKGWYGGDVLAGQMMDYNLVIGTGAGTTKSGASWNAEGRESHGINGQDPLFVDAANLDFRVLSGSPALNAGTNLVLEVGTDILGNARDSTPTIGAYESAGEAISDPASGSRPNRLRGVRLNR